MGQHQQQVSNSQGNLIIDDRLRNYEKVWNDLSKGRVIADLMIVQILYPAVEHFIHRTIQALRCLSLSQDFCPKDLPPDR